MVVRLEVFGLTTLVTPEGRLDLGTAAVFQAQVDPLLTDAPTSPVAVIIDCARLDYVSSAGLRVFLLAARAAQRNARTLALCGLQPAVREVFEVSGFSRLIAVHADRAAALALLATMG